MKIVAKVVAGAAVGGALMLALTPSTGVATAPVALPTPIAAVATKSATVPTQLSVLTYNVEGLPWPVRLTRGAKLTQIAETLQGLRAAGRQPHVIVLQEAFRADAKSIATRAGYRYIATGPTAAMQGAGAATAEDRAFAANASALRGETEGKWLDSGLVIASDYPIVAVRRMAYPTYACAGFDCLANKGVLAAAIRVPGVSEPVAVIATHLNSRAASHAPTARNLYAYQRQIDALGDFVRRVVPENLPFVLAGDLNVGPRFDRHSYLISNSASWRTAEPLGVAMQSCLSDPSCGKRNLTDIRFSYRRSRDWQFFSPGGQTKMQVNGLNGLFGRGADGAMLSDHVGYVASYTLTPAFGSRTMTVASR